MKSGGRLTHVLAGLALAAVAIGHHARCDAATLCAKKSGLLAVRDGACKRKETAVDPIALGLQGSPGVQGPRGEQGVPGPIAGTPAGGALAGTYPDPSLAPAEQTHVVGDPFEPSYATDWRPYGGAPFGDLGFSKDPMGVVHLTGLTCKASGPGCTSATLIGGQIVLFILPEGYRPAQRELFLVMSVGQGAYYPARIDVTPAGEVTLVSPPSLGEDWVSFSGVTFQAVP